MSASVQALARAPALRHAVGGPGARACPPRATTPPVGSLLMGWLLGLAQGIRHGLEPDHVAAVSTMLAEQKTARSSIFFAAVWGVGHALMLVGVGGILFLLRREMPGDVARWFELFVAAMLVGLGIRALRQSVKAGRSGRAVPHRHGATVHTHGAATEHVHVRRWALAQRPLVVGLLHGLAGSGALTALVASSFRSPATGLVFMGLYGIGAMIGMALLAGALGVPLARAMRSRLGPPVTLAAAGSFSLVLGFVWGWPIVRAMMSG